MYNGLLVVNKPKGVVSKDVSRVIQRGLRPQKIKLGHVGTLDPLADGALPVLLGEATKLQDYLLVLPKEYVFTVEFGSMTTTMDLDGEVVETSDLPNLAENNLEEITGRFLGEISQTPPIYSAIKFKGRPLYDYARKGEASLVDLNELRRNVFIYDIEILSKSNKEVSIKVCCSKGTYVRSLAYDICRQMSVVGTVVKLHRSNAAGFSLDNSVSLGDIETDAKVAMTKLISIEKLSIGLGNVSFNAEIAAKLCNGLTVEIELDYFRNELKASANSSHLDGDIKSEEPFLMINEQGRAFGVGTIKTINYCSVSIKMKRGISYGKQ